MERENDSQVIVPIFFYIIFFYVHKILSFHRKNACITKYIPITFSLDFFVCYFHFIVDYKDVLSSFCSSWTVVLLLYGFKNCQSLWLGEIIVLIFFYAIWFLISRVVCKSVYFSWILYCRRKQFTDVYFFSVSQKCQQIIM